MKKIIALILAGTMVLGGSIGASALSIRKKANTASTTTSTTSTNGYRLEVYSNKTAAILQDNNVFGEWDLKNTKVTLLKSKDGGVAVQFTEDGGGTKRITLGTEDVLTVDGNLDSLTLASTLGKNAEITVASDATIKTMSVASNSDVKIDGTVNRLEITTRSGNVTASSGSDVGSLSTITRSAFSGPITGSVRLINSSNTFYQDEENNTSTNNQYSGRYYDSTSGRYYYYDSNEGSFYYNDSNGDRHYDRYYTPSNYDGSYRQYYADGTWATVNGTGWARGSDIGVSSAKLANDNTLQFECDISGADIYWNGKYLGTTSKGSNKYSVTSYTTTRSNTLRLTKSGYNGTSLSISGYYYDPDYTTVKDVIVNR